MSERDHLAKPPAHVDFAHTPMPPARAAATSLPPVQLDATRTISLLLRDVTGRIEAAVRDKTPSRNAGLLAAAASLSESADKLSGVADRKVDWTSLHVELGAITSASLYLQSALVGCDLTGASELVAFHRKDIADLVEVGDGALAKRMRDGTAAKWKTVEALTSDERFELCRQGIACARGSIAEVLAEDHLDDHKRIRLLCTRIPVQIGTAIDAALAISDRRERARLTPDVHALTADLDHLHQLLTMSPKHKWELVFAQIFDGEKQLHRVTGLQSTMPSRDYSGMIDPSQAAARVKEIVGEDHAERPPGSQRAEDPQTAINAISTGLRFVHEAQLRAVDEVDKQLTEPPPPKDPSIFDIVLDIAVNVALNAVSGGIGGALADHLKGIFEGSAKRGAARIAEDVVRSSRGLDKVATDKLREKIINTSIRGGSIYRATAVDSAKDAAKVYFRDATNAALKEARPKHANYALPRNAFISQHANVLHRAQHHAELGIVHLANALAQLDLETLNELAQALNGTIYDTAKQLQTDATMREWQNYKAHLYAVGTGGRDVDLSSPFSNDGVLEAHFLVDSIDPLKYTRIKSMRLPGVEPRALEHLKSIEPRRLDKLGLNAKYKYRFEDSNGAHGELTLGVGPDRGLQKPPEPDLSLLKLIAANMPMSKEFALYAMAGGVDHITDAAAMQIARHLVRDVAAYTTVWLEGY